MPVPRTINYDYTVHFECRCSEELSAGFYDEGRDTWYVECPECRAVYVVAKPFVASLEGLRDDASETLNLVKGIEEPIEES